MAKIEIYSTAICPYCVAAKTLLVERGAGTYEEHRIDRDPARFAEMRTRSGNRRTVPQIFIGDKHIGGYDDLVALDRAGGLLPLLTA
jgi:glutaredoxin 3